MEATIGDSKKLLCKKFAKCKLVDITINPEQWITEIKLLRLYLGKLNVKFDD